jgi:hypothetical protein
MSVILSLLYCPNLASGASLHPFHRLGRKSVKDRDTKDGEPMSYFELAVAANYPKALPTPGMIPADQESTVSRMRPPAKPRPPFVSSSTAWRRFVLRLQNQKL